MAVKSETKKETQKDTLYEQLADRIARSIEDGAFRAGERIPSVRKLKRQMGVSLATVLAAYGLLEDRGLIEARPQSGYYVRARLTNGPTGPSPELPSSVVAPTALSIAGICAMLMGDPRNRDFVPLGAAVPNPELLPVDKLTRARSNRRLAAINAKACYTISCPAIKVCEPR